MKAERILLPFDGSVHSLNAAQYALDLAKLCKGHVTILHCYDEWDANFADIPEALIEEIRSTRKAEANGLLQKADEIFSGQGVEYSLESANGEPGQILTERSKSQKYDLIIMGSHGHSDIAGLFLGSVTHKVLNTIYCPVLVVP